MSSTELVSIAVLMTCHNRVLATMSAVRSLTEQGPPDQALLAVILVDAGSTDGTSEEVSQHYPAVTVIPADKDTYWGGGMAAAAAAAGTVHDFHLWLNDDVVLDTDAIGRLLAVARGNPEAVIVGALRDSSGARSYGGFRRGTRPLQFLPVDIRPDVTACDTMNGNVVLVPRAVTELLGPVEPAFPHAMGDIDFGLRATGRGISVLQAPGTVGVCQPHVEARARQPAVERLRSVAGVKRLPPRAWWRFCWRHAAAWAPLYFVKPYVETLVRRPH